MTSMKTDIRTEVSMHGLFIIKKMCKSLDGCCTYTYVEKPLMSAAKII